MGSHQVNVVKQEGWLDMKFWVTVPELKRCRDSNHNTTHSDH